VLFVVTMSHPDGPEWGTHVIEHVNYLNDLIEQGKLRASGPAVGTTLRTGVLLFTVAERAEVDALIAGDPFAREGLIEELTVIQWDPLFGAFAADSSRGASA